MHSLDQYGLDGCYYITSNVYNVPEWDQLHTLYPMKEHVYAIAPLLHEMNTQYEFGSILAVGTYGKVFHAKRA
jgi:hypothetical protein